MKRTLVLLTFGVLLLVLGQVVQGAELWWTTQLSGTHGDLVMVANRPGTPGDRDRDGRHDWDRWRDRDRGGPPHRHPWPHPYLRYGYRPIHPPVVIVPYPGHPPVIMYPGPGCVYPYPRSYIYYQGNRFGIGIAF
jgi:hypothetical protein